jgi:hypothetical protein
VISFLLKTAVSMLVFSGLLYATFFIPLGRHTLYGHLARIVETDEAQELGGEVAQVVEGAGRGVVARFGNPPPQPKPGD